MTLLLYGFILWLALPLILAYHCYRSISRGRPAALAERFGFIDEESIVSLRDSEVVWVHAVSVGETIAVSPLITELKRRWPQRKIVVSNVTETGREVAGKLAGVDLCLYFPFDFPFASRRLLRMVRPALIVVVETEIWPNFLRNARNEQIPVVMVNGRISDRSARRYLKLGWFFRPVLADVSAFCMQSEEDARRIISIGAKPARVQTTGNLKYDVPVARLSAEERSAVREAYGIAADALVFTAGSTHAGEDEAVLRAFTSVASEFGNIVLVLAPRHPERSAAVAELLGKNGIGFTMRSRLQAGSKIAAGEALLVDTVGELKKLYSLSDVVFVGGSLVPTGGHNVLEPASFGLPVLFGPHMSNFREISASILERGGAVQVADGVALEEELRFLCADQARRLDMGTKGMRWLAESSGAVERHMAVIDKLLVL